MTNSTTPTHKGNRVLKVLRPVQADGTGRVRLSVTRGRKVQVDEYQLQTFAAFDGAALGVSLTKGDGTVYHCCLASGSDRSCDCRGHERWRTECKHLAALQVLRDRGQLPLPLSEDPTTDAAGRYVLVGA